MAHHRVEIPVAVYERVLDLQERILSYMIEPDDAREEMMDLLAPYVTHMPDETDTTEFVLASQIISLPGVLSYSSTRKEIN